MSDDTLFWENVFRNLGFEKIILSGKPAFKIPIYEAIYLCQALGTTEWKIKKYSRGEAYIFLENEQILIFPNPCPSVRIGDVTTVIKYQETIECQINPLLSPSLDFIRQKHPKFFDNDYKYLMFSLGSKAIEDIARRENIEISDIVSLHLPEYKEDMNESLITYIVSSFLRKKGFIVDRFNESLGTGGYPDFFAFKLSQVQNKLIDYGIIEGGFYLNEIELLNKREKVIKINEDKSILVEVESFGKSRFNEGIRQTKKYLEGGYYNEGYIAIPFEKRRINARGKPEELGFNSEEEIGIFIISEDGNILKQTCPKDYGKGEKVRELLINVERIIKLTLLKNLSLRQVFDLLPRANSFYDIYFQVDNLRIETIIEEAQRGTSCI